MKISSQRRIMGIEFTVIQFLIVVDLFVVALKKYKSLGTAFKVVRSLLNFGDKIIGGRKRSKAIYNNGYYSFSMFHPKWPSYSFRKYFDTVFESIIPTKSTGAIRRVLLAITKKCPLACEHCSEWDTLYAEDVLSLADWQNLLDDWVAKGIGQIVYSGGEPITRYKDLISLIARYEGIADQWMYSSGFGLTLKKANALKDAGLDGVAISIDNHIEDSHNSFRGSQQSFQLAVEAIRNCQKAGILTALSICPTRDYVNNGHLLDYMNFAAKLGVPFVTVFEPRAVGHYHGKDVEFTDKEKEIVEKLFYEINMKQAYKDYPILLYPALIRKQTQCGGGFSYVFIDYDGSTYNCPFCKMKWTADKKVSECTADLVIENKATHSTHHVPVNSLGT